MLKAVLSAFMLIVAAASLPAGVAYRQQPDPRPLSPNDAVAYSLADVQGIQLDDVRYTSRYLSLAHMPAGERAEFCQVLDFVLNSLSRRRTITYCTPVTGSNGAVVRVLLEAYGISPDAWDNLAIKGSGPVRIAKKTNQPEEYFYAGSSKTRKVTKKRQQKNAAGELLWYDGGKTPAMEDYDEIIVDHLAGQWIDAANMLALQTATKTSYPILRADWFLANATITPAYNELLGFKTLKDFQSFVRFEARNLDLSTKGIVVNSQEVALHQRAILVTPTALGRYMETYDYFDSRGEDNLMKDLVKKRRDAGEIFAEGLNGMQFFLLINDKDEVIDFADPNVATDQNTAWRNKLVFGGMISCVGCHVDGAKSVSDEVRALTAPPIGLLIPTNEKKKAEEVKDLFYSGGIEDLIVTTKAVNASRVALSTRGLTPAKNTAALKRLFVSYWQNTLTLEDAAREVGTTAAEIKPLLAAMKVPSPDPTVTQLLAGRPVRRDMWLDGGMQQMATIVYQMKRSKP